MAVVKLSRRGIAWLAIAVVLFATAVAIATSVAGTPPASLTSARHGAAPPRHFWRTAPQAVALADRQPAVTRLRATAPGVQGAAVPASLGLWAVTYRAAGRAPVVIDVEDRTGDVLPSSNWSWPSVGTRFDSYKLKLELIFAGLGIAFLLAFFDWRRPLQMANADAIALLSFGVSFAFFDRGHPLVSVPLAYPALVYVFVRLLMVGLRGAPKVPSPRRLPSERTLLIALVTVVAARIVLNLVLGKAQDVAYASVFGANAIHHGFPLYVPGINHLDTYGPINYLAYLPFELIFPMNANWSHDFLPAAHAATITFDLLTMVGLFLVGRKLALGHRGRRLGLLLALGWATYPFTFFPFVLNTNDGLVPLFVVYALLALNSPAVRGAVLGLGAAAKFAPLALAALFATGRGDRHLRSLSTFATVLGAVIFVSVAVLLPPEGLALVWQKTLQFQFQRHSFLSIWGQQPELYWLQTLVKAATVAIAAVTLVYPRRRDTVQIAALAGAILVGLELSMSYWSYVYLAWFAPLAILAVCAVPRGQPATDREQQAGIPQAVRPRVAIRVPVGAPQA
jgi:hypothetical protein